MHLLHCSAFNESHSQCACSILVSQAIAPNLEKLASRSVQFQRAYVSVAVCAPSRTAFLTGLRPDTTQVWTIGPYFRNTSRGEGMQVIPLPQFFRSKGYNTTGSGKIFHPGTPSGGIITSEGGGDMCPGQRTDNMAVCKKAPAASEPGVSATFFLFFFSGGRLTQGH